MKDLTNGLSHPYHLDESIFNFRDIGSNFSFFISFFDENYLSKQNSPRCDAAFYLPVSHKKEARLIWVKQLFSCIVRSLNFILFCRGTP